MNRFFYGCAIRSRRNRHQFVPAWTTNVLSRISSKTYSHHRLDRGLRSLEQKHPNQNAFHVAIHFQSHLYNPGGRQEQEMEKGVDTLEEVFGRVVNVLIGKGRHEVVGVIVVRLVVDLDLIGETLLLGGGFEVFGEELALLVEVVSGALQRDSRIRRMSCWRTRTRVRDIRVRAHTTSIRMSRSFPVHFLSSSVASCSFHFSCWSSPK
jgi:hypothetical protein